MVAFTSNPTGPAPACPVDGQPMESGAVLCSPECLQKYTAMAQKLRADGLAGAGPGGTPAKAQVINALRKPLPQTTPMNPPSATKRAADMAASGIMVPSGLQALSAQRAEWNLAPHHVRAMQAMSQTERDNYRGRFGLPAETEPPAYLSAEHRQAAMIVAGKLGIDPGRIAETIEYDTSRREDLSAARLAARNTHVTASSTTARDERRAAVRDQQNRRRRRRELMQTRAGVERLSQANLDRHQADIAAGRHVVYELDDNSRRAARLADLGLHATAMAIATMDA